MYYYCRRVKINCGGHRSISMHYYSRTNGNYLWQLSWQFSALLHQQQWELLMVVPLEIQCIIISGQMENSSGFHQSIRPAWELGGQWKVPFWYSLESNVCWPTLESNIIYIYCAI